MEHLKVVKNLIKNKIYTFDSVLVRRMQLMLVNWNCHTKYESDLFFYARKLKKERFRPVFE